MVSARPLLLMAIALLCLLSHATAIADQDFKPLFPKDGIPEGWVVRDWADISNPPPADAKWSVENGVLNGSTPRGTWLISEAEYSDFVLEFDFKLGPQGNSGCALRCPLKGDPAYDGMELQIVDPRYYGDYKAGAAELTGALYKAAAPKQQLYKPEEWNTYRITCKGGTVQVTLNGQQIQDVDLDKQTETLERGTPLKDRPRKGHIGFQELSRGGGHVMIRNARIKTLD